MVDIIPRSAWGARHEDGGGSAPLPAKEWWLHHSVTIAPDLVPPFDDDDAAIRTLERIGEDRFGRGISYTFAITPVGRVYQGHGMGRLGAHTGGRNSIARAICLVGNYDTAKPTAAQIEAAAQLLVQEYRAGRSARYTLNGGHQQAPGASTACPGRHGMAAIAAINTRAAALVADAPLEDDMTPEQARQLQAVYDAMFTGGKSMPYGASLPALVDDLPRRVWATPIIRDGKTLPALQELADAKTQAITARGELAGLQTALAAANSGQPVDLEAVRAAARAGAEEALAQGVDVRATISVGEPENR